MENKKAENVGNFLAFKRLLKKPLIKKSALIFAFAVFLLAALIFGYNLYFRDKILPQTYIGGINLGGKTKPEAQAILESYASKNNKNEIDLLWQDKNWKILTSDIGVSLNPNDSVDLAWNVGRTGSFSKVIGEQLRSVFVGNKRLAVFSYAPGILNAKILDIANQIDVSEEDAGVKIENLTAEVTPEKIGRKLDFIQTNNDVLTTIGSFQENSDVNLKVDQINPKVISSAAEDAANNVNTILQNTLTLKSAKKNYTLAPGDFAPWLTFAAVISLETQGKVDLKTAGQNNAVSPSSWHLEVTIDQAKVQNYLNSIGGEINQDPKDAKFSVTNGQVTTFALSQTGYTLDVDKAKATIAQAILQKTSAIDLPVAVTQPKVASDSANAMGIKELVGEGKTSWRGSPPNRIHNLTLGTNNISGTIVQPGQEFSTVQTIGEIDGAHGFLPELVIKNSTQVVPDFGGGLCQVSTTLFRAVLNSGLKITARTPHSFRVSYYEPPVGEDATIYDPAPDFKFVNDMSTPILIWGVAGNNGLDFQIYGTKDGRQVNISAPSVGNFVPPPPPVYTVSDTMEPGTIRQVEKALQGCTASFHYSVTDASGKSLENQTFVSKYVPLPDSYLVGDGYPIPPSG